MDYTKKKLEKNQYELEIILNKTEWENAIESAYQQTKNKYKVEGFRNGKAPRKVIEKQYGEKVFYEDALTDAFYHAYHEVLDKETEIEPVAYPQIDIKNMDEKGVTFLATVDVRPDFKLAKYKGLKVVVAPKEITEKEVQAELKNIQEQHSRLVEITDRAVEKGDTVNLDFSGSVNGKLFEGGTAEGFDLEIGSKSFIDNFEDQLIGLNINDEKNVEVSFPSNYQEKSLQGKKAVFKCKINSIKKKELPEINDEFASNVSEFENIEDYEKSIKVDLEKKAEKDAKVLTENKIIDTIADATEVEIPASMTNEEIEAEIEDMQQRMAYQGIKFEDYLTYMNTDIDKFKETRKKEAEKAVKVRLILQEIVKKENLIVTDAELDEKLENFAKATNKTIEEYKLTISEGRINYLKNDILMNKLMNFLLENNQ